MGLWGVPARVSDAAARGVHVLSRPFPPCLTPCVPVPACLTLCPQDRDYATAARLAFDLKHPGRLLACVNQAASGVGGGGRVGVQQLLTGLVSGGWHWVGGCTHRPCRHLCGLGVSLHMTLHPSAPLRSATHCFAAASPLPLLVHSNPPHTQPTHPIPTSRPPPAPPRTQARHMGDEDLGTALGYCRDWNTNSRHCHAAQALLGAVLRSRKPAAIAALPGGRAGREGGGRRNGLGCVWGEGRVRWGERSKGGVRVCWQVHTRACMCARGPWLWP